MNFQIVTASRSRLKMEMELDRLSNLPSEVTDQILCKFPIKEAVRTCVLSSKWRYKSAMLKNLVFDEQCESTLDHSALVNIVDRVLLLHIGPIDKFMLSHQDLEDTSDIDRWILHLSRNSIKELILDIWKGSVYNIPSCLFSCQDIIHLELSNCLLKLPPTFKGFRSLKSIDIQDVMLAQNAFEDLIVCSPLLESLTLKQWKDFTHLKINAPNLQFLDIEGVFEDVILENTSNLADVTICLDHTVGEMQVPGCSSNLLRLFVHLPQIQRLEMEKYFLKYLSVGASPRKLPKPCLYLEYLFISICFKDLEEILTALCLLRSSPALQELELEASYDGQVEVGEVNSWLDDNMSCQFPQLKLVKITGISAVKAGLDFIRILLLSSPVLESMTVKPTTATVSSELLKNLVRFKRSSVDAEIIYLDP